MMIKEYKPFVQETLGDALSLVRERFPESALDIVRQALQNPCLKDGGSSGAIGYKNAVPVAFQMEMPRLLYCGQIKMNGLVGGMTCKALKGCPLSILLETIDRSCDIADANTLFLGNTCCAATSQMDESSGSNLGPESCTRYCYAVIRPLEFFAYVFRRKVLKLGIPHWKNALPVGKTFVLMKNGLLIRRKMELDETSLDNFWQRYLLMNKGVVLSRTARELKWIFADRIASSKCVLLVAYAVNEVIGYIILTAPACHARRWEIGDMIAIDNSPDVIDVLLYAAKKFLTKNTSAFLLETIGFPMSIQNVIKKHLPRSRKTGCNFFSYAFASDGLKARCQDLINSSNSWFFGPYDGDMCMG